MRLKLAERAARKRAFSRMGSHARAAHTCTQNRPVWRLHWRTAKQDYIGTAVCILFLAFASAALLRGRIRSLGTADAHLSHIVRQSFPIMRLPLNTAMLQVFYSAPDRQAVCSLANMFPSEDLQIHHTLKNFTLCLGWLSTLALFDDRRRPTTTCSWSPSPLHDE